jgi:hypothetical protein
MNNSKRTRRQTQSASKNGRKNGKTCTSLQTLPNSYCDVILRPISSVQPAPENSLVYHATTADDPTIQELAADIKLRGILDPIVINCEGWILSGHRRHVAALIVGLDEVPCRMLNVPRSDPEFEQLLVAFNLQRTKSFDEVIREFGIRSNPEDAYANLVSDRKERAKVAGASLELGDPKRRTPITRNKQPFLDAILRVLHELRDFLPVSERKIHYSLLNDPPLRHAFKKASRYANDRSSAQELSKICTTARVMGLIPRGVICDETRPFTGWSTHPDAGSFVQESLSDFLKYYARDLQRSQPAHVECWGEKLTLEGSIRPVCMEYCIPYTLMRGFVSIPPRERLVERFEKSGKEKLIVLLFGDFDSDGEKICESCVRSFRDDFKIAEERIFAKKVCLRHDQVAARNLPATFDPKTDSPNYPAFIQKYGEDVVAHEIEVLHPSEIAPMLDETIRSVLDIDLYNQEVDAEKEDAARLDALRRKIGPLIREALDEDDDA